jgi:hypothetical protein
MHELAPEAKTARAMADASGGASALGWNMREALST